MARELYRMTFGLYCAGCGEFSVYHKGDLCGECQKKTDPWPHKRFKEGDVVNTPKGIGEIVGFDLPYNNAVWRWGVKMDAPSQKVLYFFDKEVKEQD